MDRTDAVSTIVEAVINCSAEGPTQIITPYKSSNLLKFLNLNIAIDKSQDDFLSFINKNVLK